MNCNQFKNKYDQFTKVPLSKEIWESDEYGTWFDHMEDCTSCSDWHLKQTVINRGHKVSDFPCVHIAYRVTQTCEDHPNPWDCPDIMIVKKDKGYGLPVRDGGSSYIKIEFCPWCGTKI
jgi:hypothetical protein